MTNSVTLNFFYKIYKLFLEYFKSSTTFKISSKLIEWGKNGAVTMAVFNFFFTRCNLEFIKGSKILSLFYFIFDIFILAVKKVFNIFKSVVGSSKSEEIFENYIKPTNSYSGAFTAIFAFGAGFFVLRLIGEIIVNGFVLNSILINVVAIVICCFFTYLNLEVLNEAISKSWLKRFFVWIFDM